jgi:mono/diheme cytochrome c family protein
MPGPRARFAFILAGLGLMTLAGQAWSQGNAPAGQALFEDRCADCHRVSGEGLPPTFPALKGSALVQGDPAKAIDTVLNGRKGLSTMPAWKDILSDQELAAILTYVRAAWGNQAGPVTAEQVAARRK